MPSCLSCPHLNGSFPCRSLGGSWYRCGRPPQALHSQDELRQGLGSRLPPAEHQGDPLLDRDPSAQGATVTGRGSAHHAHCRPTAPRLRLLLECTHTRLGCQDCCFSAGCRGHKSNPESRDCEDYTNKRCILPHSHLPKSN